MKPKLHHLLDLMGDRTARRAGRHATVLAALLGHTLWGLEDLYLVVFLKHCGNGGVMRMAWASEYCW